MNKQSEHTKGIIFTALAYFMWGFLPLYWKPLHSIEAGELLSHRIVWSFVFMMIIVVVTGKTRAFFQNLKQLFTERKHFFAILAASLLISANWLIYIWAVNADHVIEASMGYYINPLISVLLGIIVLKEKLNFWQKASFGVALIGVLMLTIQYGHFPWIALSLALSFGLYGLVKKLGNYDAVLGLTYETMFVTPLALLFLLFWGQRGFGVFATSGAGINALILCAGIATAIPLLFFASGAQRISLAMVGFLQYIAPSIMLLLGVFLYHELFSTVHLIAFCFIWLALLLFSFSKHKWMVRLQPKNKRKTYSM
ncbi:rarD protein [Fictibacillus macauensis ZFHKF-1]|uniref:RarD protein n=1 Tax=Fictibacillus macauensis ZFHKF-1 TaxID=1196324 RepID=I8UIX1_9BACL|nr:EamA family transporter RarD [Fictibacillus macauensis]EIT86778.1 rarD protein [Fictibacillus macauensis ZFHKF-1]